jgi:FkbM family methyltransferase
MIDTVFDKWKIAPKGIIHIGANFCNERMYYHRAGCDDSKIVWVEAIPAICERCKIFFPYATILNEAVSDAEYDVEFRVSSNNGESSSIFDFKDHADIYPSVKEAARIKMRTISLPNMMTKYNLDADKYDFLVMDIQGAEMHALRGMGDMINKFKFIVLEVSIFELYASQGTFNDVLEFLMKRGFSLIDLEMHAEGWGDALFTSSIDNLTKPVIAQHYDPNRPT